MSKNHSFYVKGTLLGTLPHIQQISRTCPGMSYVTIELRVM